MVSKGVLGSAFWFIFWTINYFIFLIFNSKAFADALLIIPKTLAVNAGHNAQDVIIKLLEAYNSMSAAEEGGIVAVGLDLSSGEACIPQV